MNRLLLLSGLVSVTGFGQLSLTNTSFPEANDQTFMSTLLDLQIDYASTGANYTWDYSGLVPTGQRITDYKPLSAASTLSNLLFGTFASTPYKASYFNASTDIPLEDLTASFPVTIGGISGFSKSTAAALTMVGWEFVINGTGIPVKSDTIETRYAFPLDYGDSYASRGYTRLNMSPIYEAQWIQHRSRESEVDGWGTITTPYGTYSTLRIHHRILESDSLFIPVNGGTWIGIPVPESHEYEWRAAGETEPILRVKTSVVLGTETVTAVEYRSDFDPTLSLSEEELTFELFPNPVTDQLSVTAGAVISSVQVINQQGQSVGGSVDLNGVSAVADLSMLGSGSYFVIVTTGNGTSIRMIVKD